MHTILRRVACAAAVACAALAASAQTAASATDAAALPSAQDVPIADVHMHLYPGLTVQALRDAMDRNKVLWGGAVGPIGASALDRESVRAALGPRYIPAGAQVEQTTIFFSGGAAEMVDADAPSFQQLLATLRKEFADQSIAGLGELILSNRNSSAIVVRNGNRINFTRTVPLDAPTYRQLYALAAEHQGFVQLHVEDGEDDIAQLKAVLQRHPALTVIASHCLQSTSPQQVRTLMEAHPNLYCELSFRSSVLLNFPAGKRRTIHGPDWLDKDWQALIEALPERFMVGSDVTHPGASYDAVIGAVRGGLLAHLSPPTRLQVAHGNARRLFKLQDVAP